MSVHRCIDEFFGALDRGEDAFGGFVTAVRALDEPEAEIASALDALLTDPESRHAHLWIVAAEARSSPKLVEPLCRILETPGLKLSDESVVDALRPLRDERAVPALVTAFGYTLDFFDPGRAMQSSILFSSLLFSSLLFSSRRDGHGALRVVHPGSGGG